MSPSGPDGNPPGSVVPDANLLVLLVVPSAEAAGHPFVFPARPDRRGAVGSRVVGHATRHRGPRPLPCRVSYRCVVDRQLPSSSIAACPINPTDSSRDPTHAMPPATTPVRRTQDRAAHGGALTFAIRRRPRRRGAAPASPRSERRPRRGRGERIRPDRRPPRMLASGRARSSRSCVHDRSNPPFSIGSPWEPTARSASFPIGRDSPAGPGAMRAYVPVPGRPARRSEA